MGGRTFIFLIRKQLLGPPFFFNTSAKNQLIADEMNRIEFI